MKINYLWDTKHKSYSLYKCYIGAFIHARLSFRQVVHCLCLSLRICVFETKIWLDNSDVGVYHVQRFNIVFLVWFTFTFRICQMFLSNLIVYFASLRFMLKCMHSILVIKMHTLLLTDTHILVIGLRSVVFEEAHAAVLAVLTTRVVFAAHTRHYVQEVDVTAAIWVSVTFTIWEGGRKRQSQ